MICKCFTEVIQLYLLRVYLNLVLSYRLCLFVIILHVYFEHPILTSPLEKCRIDTCVEASPARHTTKKGLLRSRARADRRTRRKEPPYTSKTGPMRRPKENGTSVPRGRVRSEPPSRHAEKERPRTRSGTVRRRSPIRADMADSGHGGPKHRAGKRRAVVPGPYAHRA